MLPTTDHLFWLRHDKEAFEAERNRLISDYIKSLPEHQRVAAHAMQCKIDLARQTLSPDEFLKWMQQETAEMARNMNDLFLAVQHRAQDIKNALSRSGE